MKRAFAFVVGLALAFALVPSVAAAPIGATKAADLFAGQSTDVGDVFVWNDAATLFVEIDLATGWCMSESHVAVASSPLGIPQTKTGNPIPGKFAEGASYDPCEDTDTFEFALSGFDATPVIAVHAKVWDQSSQVTETVVSNTSTNVKAINGVPVVGTVPAVLANEPFNYPNCASYTPNDTSKSVWDNGIGSAWNDFDAAGADWIWSTLNPLRPLEGDYVTFGQTFSIGWPLVGTLEITADNGYTAGLNGVFTGSAQLGPGFPGTLKETLVATPQAGSWGVASQGWQSVETHVLSGLKTGTNTLLVTAANEYMWNDGGFLGADFYYGSWDPSGGSINADPTPGTGLAGDGICRNPGGLVYKLSVDHYTHSETAWAGTAVGVTPFPGANWATYFAYGVQSYVFGDTVATTPFGAVDLDFEVWGGPPAFGTTSWARTTGFVNSWEGPVVSATIGTTTASFTVRVATGTPVGIDLCDITIAVTEGGAGIGTWNITSVVNSPFESCPFAGQIQGPYTITGGSIDVFSP